MDKSAGSCAGLSSASAPQRAFTSVARPPPWCAISKWGSSAAVTSGPSQVMRCAAGCSAAGISAGRGASMLTRAPAQLAATAVYMPAPPAACSVRPAKCSTSSDAPPITSSCVTAAARQRARKCARLPAPCFAAAVPPRRRAHPAALRGWYPCQSPRRAR